MAAIILATGLSHLLSHVAIYTRKLLRRGVDIDRSETATIMADMPVGQMTEPIGTVLPADTSVILAGH